MHQESQTALTDASHAVLIGQNKHPADILLVTAVCLCSTQSYPIDDGDGTGIDHTQDFSPFFYGFLDWEIENGAI